MIAKNFGSNNFNDYKREVDRGGKFIIFQYCVSILIYTFRVSSDIYLIKGGETTVSRSFKYSIVSLIAGWWGIPWGPIYTIQSLISNVRGGIDVTDELMEYQNKLLNPRNQYF